MNTQTPWRPAKNCTLILLASLWAGMGIQPLAAGTMETPSDKELSTMGQGFGKFVGSFMRQVQSDEAHKGMSSSGEERRLPERSSKAPEWPTPRSEEHSAQGGQQNRNSNRNQYYPLYDPWGAAWWSDPAFGFDPWGRDNSWVDHDWHNRRWQYGWNYGQTGPYGGYRAASPGWEGDGPPGWVGEGERYPGGAAWGNPYGSAERYGPGPYGGERNAFNNEWLRQREERHPAAAEDPSARLRSREGERWPAHRGAGDERWRRD
ncbi:MAG: hypothetical protein HQM04_01920 [Magnetococcales bacterium]|nr:hypothetical protein [Magnetococcales bacterium]MBF0113777.1 hypothetical protein [Magnetococcales bacterium]